jgi:hypothetical protein
MQKPGDDSKACLIAFVQDNTIVIVLELSLSSWLVVSRKPMIVALARKLIIALWRYANTGLVPEGFQLRSAA